MAKRANSGSGLVITLIVFILLAITGIGLAIHFHQQLQIAEEAVRHNQATFRDYVGEVFDDAGWNLRRATRASYGIVYEQEAYSAVAEKLRNAHEYEKMAEHLPWKAAEHVQRALSDYMPSGENFNTADGLLDYYSEQYRKLRETLENVNFENRRFVEELKEKDEALKELLAEKNQEIERFEREYAEKIQEINRQFADLEGKWKESREENWASFFELEDKISSLEENIAEANEAKRELAAEAERYKAKLVQDEPEVFEPEGNILAVENNRVMISGGEHSEHRRNQQITIFRESPTGQPVFVGDAIISRVFETTSMANVIEREMPVMEGHLFVKSTAWEDKDAREVAKAPDDRVTPARRPHDEPEDPVKAPDPTPEVDLDEADDDDDDFFIF